MKAVNRIAEQRARGIDRVESPPHVGTGEMATGPQGYRATSDRAAGRDAEGGGRSAGERLYRVTPERFAPDRFARGGAPRLGGWGLKEVALDRTGEEACWNAFRGAVLAACEGPQGKTRAVVARLLGVAEKTLEHWMNPGEPDRRPHMGVLMQLVSRRDILPDAARLELLRAVCEGGGLVVMLAPEVDIDQSPATVQMLEILAAHGRAAETLRRALEGHSERGDELSGAERGGLAVLAREVLREAAELVTALEADVVPA